MAGDVFAMQPPDGRFLYGRVIANDANPLSVGGGILLYVYRARADKKDDVPELSRDDLLTAPLITNRQPWSKGYFEHIAHAPLTHEDRLPRHCFQDFGRYFDEYANELDGSIPPPAGIGEWGQWGLHSYRTIDDEISKALGIPLAPEEP